MQLFLDNFSTALIAPASPAVLSIPPEDAARLVGLDGVDHYCLTAVQRDEQGREIAWEIIRVTGRTGGNLTVSRAQEGTTQLDLAAGAELHMRLTAAVLMGLQAQIKILSSRVAALEGPGPGPGPEGALLDADGNQLTDNLGAVLTGANT